MLKLVEGPKNILSENCFPKGASRETEYPWRDLPPAEREAKIDAYLNAGGRGVLHFDIFSREDYETHLLELDAYISIYSPYYDRAYFEEIRSEVECTPWAGEFSA